MRPIIRSLPPVRVYQLAVAALLALVSGWTVVRWELGAREIAVPAARPAAGSPAPSDHAEARGEPCQRQAAAALRWCPAALPWA